VPLPETIPVRYTEEEAEYLSVRPLVKQTFRMHELVDMVLGVTGKDLGRIQQILRSGTLVYHFYRYWWEGFEADGGELAAILARFPDADPARVFRAEECTTVLLESSAHAPRHSIELHRETAARRRFLRTCSLWDALLVLAREQSLAYEGYSYAHRADLYALPLSAQQVAALTTEAERLAPRDLRPHLRHLPEITRIVFSCPRRSKAAEQAGFVR
jgi:hypothetical protein